MRLIDAEQAKKFAREHLSNPYEIISACAVIDSTDSVDAVPVVRCKDCKQAYISSFSESSGVVLCRLFTNRSEGKQIIMQYDDFCSYGEKAVKSEDK